MTSIIGRIALQPSVVRPGEPVRVEVFGQDDSPIKSDQAQISINGVPGTLQLAVALGPLLDERTKAQTREKGLQLRAGGRSDCVQASIGKTEPAETTETRFHVDPPAGTPATSYNL